MANGNNLLPQSALPIGQTPLATIQAPNVGVSIPSPMDISNFFRMQQGMQNNVGILQNAEQIKMQREEMDMRNYENAIRRMDALMGMGNQAFSDFYGQKKGKDKAAAQGGAAVYDFLDPTRGRHANVMHKFNSLIDGAEAKIDQMGQAFFAAGTTDPAIMAETSRGIDRVVSETRREMQQDAEYFELAKMQRAYDQFLDQLHLVKSKGANINVAAVDQLLRDYDEWTEEDNGRINLGRFNLENYIYDGGKALKGISDDAKRMGTGVKQFEEVPTTDGAILEGVRTSRMPLDEMTDVLYNKYVTDANAKAIYNNTIKGSLNEDGSEKTFKDWIRDMARPHAPRPGQESLITSTEAFIRKPEDSRTTGTRGSRSTGSGDDNRGLTNVLGRKPLASEREIVELGNNIQERGFNIETSPLTPYDWLQIGELDKKNRISTVEVDDFGNAVAKGQGTHLQIWDLGFEDEQPERMLGEFYKKQAPNRQAPVGATGQIAREDMEPGMRNNNPGNLRATDKQIEAGVPVDDQGFIIFPTLEEGIRGNFGDIDYKLRGNSDKFQNNKHLVEKYGKEALAPGKYMDVATVGDLLRVRTPVKGDGKDADNKPEETEGLIKKVEQRGFPRDMKLSELKPEDMLEFNLAIFEVESPQAWNAVKNQLGQPPKVKISKYYD